MRHHPATRGCRTSGHCAAMDVEDFLAQPLVARVAANGPNGPTVRPVWFLYEEEVLWWLTGSYSRLGTWLEVDPRVQVVIDSCDLVAGEVLSVTMSGEARVRPFEAGLASRKLSKYLGPDPERWPSRFRATFEDPSARLIALVPIHPPRLRDLSFTPVRD